MNVLVVSQYFWPETFRVNDIVSDLVRRGHRVTVLTGWPNYPDGKIFPEFRAHPERFAHYEGAEVIRVPLLARGTGSLRLILNYASFAITGTLLGRWRLRGRPFDAVFICQLSPVTAAIPGVLLGRSRGIPAIMWVLDLWPDTLAALGVVRSPKLLGLVGALVGWIYRRCTLVLGQSRAFEANICGLSGNPALFRYLPGWAEPIFEGPLASVPPAPEVEPYLDGAFNVMFAGNLGEGQDFPTILAAAERLRDRTDIRWLVVGDGRAAAWIRSEIERRGLARQVVMLGRHPIDRMPAFFRAAGALLVSLRDEPTFAMTIPGKVQAYLASGIPIVGMLGGEGARVLQEAEAGVVCAAGDAERLARAVTTLAEASPGERAAMGQRGKAYSSREFDRETLLGRLEQWISRSPEGNASQAWTR